MTDSGQQRAALFAFAGHVFGLWFLHRRLGPVMTVRNRWALGATALAMGVGGLTRGPEGVLLGWLFGHFAWGTYLAREVWYGRTGLPASQS